MQGLTTPERFFAAHCAMLFITSIAAMVVAFGLMWLARRRGDPARWCLTLIKLAALFYILFCFVEFCADAVWIAFSRLLRNVHRKSPDDWALLAALLQARVELTSASRYTDCILVILVFLAIVFFGVGVNIIRIGEQAPRDGLIKKGALAFAGVLAILATVEWGIRIRVYLEFYIDTKEVDLRSKDPWSLQLLNVSRQLDFAFVVIAWALSIATLARSTQIWLPSRKDKRLDYPLLFLLLSCGAWLLRMTYELIFQLKFVNIHDIQSTPDVPPYLEMVEIVFHSWSIFLVIILIFAAGVKKKGGLWSTQQSWMHRTGSESSEGMQLESMNPPAYSAESSPVAAPPPVATGGSPTSGTGNDRTPQGQWRQSPVSPQDSLEDGDHALVGGLGPPQRHRPSPQADRGHETGMPSSIPPAEAGPADGYDAGMDAVVADGYMGMNPGPADGFPAGMGPSPPGHDEAMGLNHQADGRVPSEPLPYPQKN